MKHYAIGFGCGKGAGNPGTAYAPTFLQSHLPSKNFQWGPIISTDTQTVEDKYELLALLHTKLAEAAFSAAKNHPFFFSFGGDHSGAIGTWSGVSEAYREQGDIGLIWIDAHMDSHTPDSSDSGNIHGMPLAALMGYGDDRLTSILTERPKVRPENVFLIGIRSYENPEHVLLEKLGVKVFFIEEVKKRGLCSIVEEVTNRLSQQTVGYGVSFDIDSIDPSEITATGTPVENGLAVADVLEALELIVANPPLAFELVEYNPLLDNELGTFEVIQRLLASLMKIESGALVN